MARLYHEGLDMLRAVLARDPGAVDRASNTLRHLHLEVGLPFCVVDVVFMKMDRAALFGRVAPVVDGAGPVVAGYRAGRQIYRFPAQAVP